MLLTVAPAITPVTWHPGGLRSEHRTANRPSHMSKSTVRHSSTDQLQTARNSEAKRCEVGIAQQARLGFECPCCAHRRRGSVKRSDRPETRPAAAAASRAVARPADTSAEPSARKLTTRACVSY